MKSHLCPILIGLLGITIILTPLVSFPSSLMLDNQTTSSLASDSALEWHHDCSNLTAFNGTSDGTWLYFPGNIVSTGSFSVDNGYIYASDYDTDSGWHGPVQYHTLANPFPLSQLLSLEVEIEMDATADNRFGKVALALQEDDNKSIVYLKVNDDWSGTDHTMGVAGWWFPNGTHVYTPCTYPEHVAQEPYHETLTLTQNSTGIFLDSPRIGNFKLLNHEELNGSRMISYISIVMQQYDVFPACETMRIHDIRMTWDSNPESEIATWHHDCSNISQFKNQQVHLNWYNLLSWSNGTWSSSGEYLYASSIDSDTGWHGPTYVAELDHVYTLGQLRNFSVEIEAINDVVGYCGKHTVYLADENFDLILAAHMNDAWSGLQQGGVYAMHRFNNYTGTDLGPLTPDSFTGFNDLVSFRVDADVGVIAHNPGYGEAVLCAWDDAEFSREIRYVILMSAQLDSYTLMPFRVHDILLEFNTDFEQPPEPEFSHPNDVDYEAGTIGHSIVWNHSVSSPLSSEIYRNSSLLESDSWDGSNIVVNIDNLSPGVYNYTNVIQFGDDEEAVDTVIVTVSDTTLPTIGHPSDIELELGTVGNSLDWTVSDLYPGTYELHLDGELEKVATWNTTGVEIPIDDLGLGWHNYTIVFYDTFSNIAKDTVIVTVVDTTTPELNHPTDLEYEVSTTGHSITWFPSDLMPQSFEIHLNGTLIESGNWNGSSITVSVNGLEPGVYEYRITVTDTSGNHESDNVLVIVASNWWYDYGNLLSSGVTAGSILIIVIVGGAFVCQRRAGANYPDPYSSG